MEWINDVSQKARDVMDALGNFGPTVNALNREVKGYTMDSNTGDCGKAYYSSDDLRNIAAGCIEVADWLDKRADIAKATGAPHA